MSLAITTIGRTNTSNKYLVEADIQFDNSYASAGEPLNPGDFRLNVIEEILLEQVRAVAAGTPLQDVELAYDRKNAKLRAYQRNKVITGESVTATLGACTALANLPTQVIAVHATVNSVEKTYYPVCSAQTLADLQCKVNYGTGVITLYYDGSHTPGAVTVDYITNGEVLSTADLSNYIVRAVAVGY